MFCLFCETPLGESREPLYLFWYWPPGSEAVDGVTSDWVHSYQGVLLNGPGGVDKPVVLIKRAVQWPEIHLHMEDIGPHKIINSEKKRKREGTLCLCINLVKKPWLAEINDHYRGILLNHVLLKTSLLVLPCSASSVKYYNFVVAVHRNTSYLTHFYVISGPMGDHFRCRNHASLIVYFVE